MIIVSVRLAVEKVDAVIVPLEATRMVVDNIERDSDAIDVTQINQNLELGRRGGDVLKVEGRRFSLGC